MHKYQQLENPPMKFHKLYISLLNPIALLIYLSLMLLSLLAISGVETLYASANLSGISLEQSRAALWITFAIVAFAFIFTLLTEIFLIRRKKIGIALLLCSYVLGLAYTIVSLVQNTRINTIFVMIVNIVICILVCIYYWKRLNLFT